MYNIEYEQGTRALSRWSAAAVTGRVDEIKEINQGHGFKSYDVYAHETRGYV